MPDFGVRFNYLSWRCFGRCSGTVFVVLPVAVGSILTGRVFRLVPNILDQELRRHRVR